MSVVLREDRDGLAILTLNRPDKLNSLTVGMFEELRKHVLALYKDDSIGCVVLRGAGRCFSAGHDLADIAEGEAVPSRGWHSETLRLMERLPKPVIAAVHGHCYTGALEVALAAEHIHDRYRYYQFPEANSPAESIDAAQTQIPNSEDINNDNTLNQSENYFQYRISLKKDDLVVGQNFITDARDMDSGLQWEILNNEGVGPDMQARIGAFMGKGRS
ncbi:MAG: enoyl-CoA hydratase [Hyphomonas sp. 32-62-5]|nr:MAG: enoyl-CoA hydratase [Hyphomonas sp. 32-62-5]